MQTFGLATDALNWSDIKCLDSSPEDPVMNVMPFLKM